MITVKKSRTLLSSFHKRYYVRDLFPILGLKIGSKLSALYRYEYNTGIYLCFEVRVCVCIIISFSSLFFLEDRKDLISHT